MKAFTRTQVLSLGLFAALGCGTPSAHESSSSSSSTGGSSSSSSGAGGGDAGMPPPVSTPPQLLLPDDGFYPRAIRLEDGTILVSVVAPQASGRMGGTILESTDDALTFHEVGHIDDALAQGGLCCASLFQLPSPLGGLPKGTLLWSASVGGDTPGQPMSIPMWQSQDRGKSWTLLSTVVVASVPRMKGGLWEPEMSQLDDGSLVCHYSDETDPAHSQKLVAARTSDGLAWGMREDTVAMSTFDDRPGMANVRRPPGGAFVMSYEICGPNACSAHLRMSADGWAWGDPTDAGLRPATVDGKHFRHAPTLAWNDTPGHNGRFYLVGQMVYDGSDQIAPENGGIVLANSEGGYQPWYVVPAPLPIANPYDNFCPNYSSTLLPLDGGAVALEVASQWDGSVCRSYYARGPLLGTGDATGVTAGGTYRLVNVQSGLCLDVAGGSMAAGGNVQQWTCNDLAPQNWVVTPAPDSTFALRNQNSGMCLAVAGGSTTAGANVEQDPCDGGAAQSWSLRNVGIGYYTLVHTGTGSCLDVAGGSTTPGGNVQQWTCNDLAPQNWHLESK